MLKLRATFATLLAVFWAGTGHAHPHIFVDTSLRLIVDETGTARQI